MILVSQGMGTVSIDGRNWHMSNVKYAGVDEDNPLLEGSMFKFGTSTVAYKSLNNLKPGYGFPTTTTEADSANVKKEFECFDADGNTITRTFNNVYIDTVGFDNSRMTASGTMRVANHDDWVSLENTDKMDRY